MEHMFLPFLGLHMEALAGFLLHITNQHILGSFSFLSGWDVVTVCFSPILDLAYCKSVTCCFTAKLLQLSHLWATSTINPGELCSCSLTKQGILPGAAILQDHLLVLMRTACTGFTASPFCCQRRG